MDNSLGYKNISFNFRNSKLPTRKSALFYAPKTKKSISGRSVQSTQIICKTSYHTVESYGAPIPVQISEALAFSDRNTVCSASISNDGWAWFVIGRRLLIWQAIGSKQMFGSVCRELTLPPSDLAYSANLISVFTLHGNQTVSCLVVSPEGLIRYWPNISSEGVSIESNANLQGQECEVVKRITPIGFIVVTTTATILLIETNNIGGRHSITCRPLTVPSGWLGGIGKRFSSIFFGGIQNTQHAQAKFIRILVIENKTPVTSVNGTIFHLYVLVGLMLQKWSLTLGEQEKLLYECNLEPIITENFLQTVWNAAADNEINICMVDMQLIESTIPTIVFLAVASNNTVPNQLHYALVTINVDGSLAPDRTASFHLVKNVDFSLFHTDHNFKKIYLLTSGQTVYMYNHRLIISTPVFDEYDEPDYINIQDTNILGGTTINRLPVFFSRVHGFIAVTSSDSIAPSDFMNTTAHSFEVSSISEMRMHDESELEDLIKYKDSNECLKAAFIFYVSKKLGQAKTMINEMFPLEDTIPQLDSALDLVAVKVSLDLINDVPAKDPRWADIKSSETVNLNSTISLQIQSQLEEKQQALDWYISFLKDMEIWKRLGSVTWNNVTVATTYVFAEQAEKLIAAIALKKLQIKYPHIMETVIKNVVKNNDMVPSGGLTAYDLFYRKVSIVHKALVELCTNCEELVCSEQSLQSVSKNISNTNNILLTIFEEIFQFRQEKGVLFLPDPKVMSNLNTELIWWTGVCEKTGVKDALMLQCGITLKYGVKSVGVLSQRQELISQLISLTNVILEGWRVHVESVQSRKTRYELLLHQYENERLTLLQPLAELEEYESAIALAEKYQDFTVLVQICDKTNDEERLAFYMDKYENKEFAQFLFSWYMREKKHGKLLSQFRSNKKHQQALSKFLVDHPNLAWLHSVFCGNYEQAADILLSLAYQEMELMKRKKYMLTLSKLTLLASGNTDCNIREKINKEINLLVYQEELPETVLNTFGYDYETMRVFLPPELIRFYICEENVNASEFDFLKALDLLNFVDDEIERKDLRYEIWCKAIQKSGWPVENVDVENPIEFIQQFLFFRIISFGLEKDIDVLSMLPPLENILESEDLGELNNNKTFQYLMKIGYEYYSTQTV